MRHAAISGFFKKDEHFRANTLIPIFSPDFFFTWFSNVSRCNRAECVTRQYLDFLGRTSTSGLIPQSPFSPDFFCMVSECVTRHYLDFSAGIWIRIRINLSCWIWIWIRILNADPDPVGQK
jgi:hypothetical protein